MISAQSTFCPLREQRLARPFTSRHLSCASLTASFPLYAFFDLPGWLWFSTGWKGACKKTSRIKSGDWRRCRNRSKHDHWSRELAKYGNKIRLQIRQSNSNWSQCHLGKRLLNCGPDWGRWQYNCRWFCYDRWTSWYCATSDRRQSCKNSCKKWCY